MEHTRTGLVFVPTGSRGDLSTIRRTIIKRTVNGGQANYRPEVCGGENTDRDRHMAVKTRKLYLHHT